MKKIIAMALLAGMTLSMTACGNEKTDDTKTDAPADEGGTQEADVKEASDGKTFTVGFDQDFPPFGYVGDDGEFTGFDIEMATECAKRMGREIVLQPIDWDAKDMELESGTIDCIWNGFTMNGREDAYTWSVPYIDNSQVFVVKSDAGIASFGDLSGKIVGVQKDSSALAALEGDAQELAASFSELKQYADYNTGFMDLEAGAIDAIAIDIGVADYQIASRGDGYVILDEKLATEQYGIGFLLGNDSLKDQVESTLLEMAKDGKFMEIAGKYGLEGSVCLGK